MLDLLRKAKGFYYMGKPEKAFELLSMEELEKELPVYKKTPGKKPEKTVAADIIEAHLFVINSRTERGEEKEYREEILKRYIIIYELVRVYKVSYESLFDYVGYLLTLEKDEEAFEIIDYLVEECLVDFFDEGKRVLLIKVYNLKGEVLLARDKDSEAIYYLEEALYIYDNRIDGRRKKGLEKEIELLYKNLGWYYQNKDSYKQAEKYYKKALKQSKKNCLNHSDYDPIRTLISFDNLGHCYLAWGKYEEAIENYEDLLDFVLKLHTLTIDILRKVKEAYDYIITLYMKNKNYEKTKAFIEEGTEFFNHFAQTNKEQLEVQAFLAGFYYHDGLYHFMKKERKESEECFLKACTEQEAISKKDPHICNEDLARTYYCLAQLYQEDGRFKKAEACLGKRILALQGNMRNPRNLSDYLIACEDFANYYYQHQDYDNAKEEYENLIRCVEEIHGKGFIDVHNLLKNCYFHMMQICEGKNLQEEASQWHDKYSKL